MKRFILDSSALVTFLENRAGAEVIEDLLTKAAIGQQFLQMSVINWGELYSAISRTSGHDAARRKIEELEHLPIELLTADDSVAMSAADWSAQHRLPYLSCIGAATAKAQKATFVTSEKEFASVGDGLKVLLV